MNAARAGGNATLLPDGDVLATSGFGVGTESGGPFAELYTPATGQWSPATNGLPSINGCSGRLARVESPPFVRGNQFFYPNGGGIFPGPRQDLDVPVHSMAGLAPDPGRLTPERFRILGRDRRASFAWGPGSRA